MAARTLIFPGLLIASTLMVTQASAQVVEAMAGHEARYREALSRILHANARGGCPVELMGERVLEPCRRSIAVAAPQMQALGELETLTLVQVSDVPERSETYRADYASGAVLNWTIGSLKDGRFDTLIGRR